MEFSQVIYSSIQSLPYFITNNIRFTYKDNYILRLPSTIIWLNGGIKISCKNIRMYKYTRVKNGNLKYIIYKNKLLSIDDDFEKCYLI